jgi:hypothetical protein
MHLPPRADNVALSINGKDLPNNMEATVSLRRERSGSYTSTDGLNFSGVLPFELGRPAAERPGSSEKWLMGTLHSTRLLPPDAGDAVAGGWALELSSTALGVPCVVSVGTKVDAEILVVGADAGRPTCLSAHAPLPTRRARPCGFLRGGGGLQSISENEKVELPLPYFREPVRVPSPALERAALLADCVPAPMISDEWDPGALHASYEVGEGISLFREHYHALAGEVEDGEHRLHAPELTWFGAGVRVGMGLGLGVCLGMGLGVGILVNTYRRTTQRVSNLRASGVLGILK